MPRTLAQKQHDPPWENKNDSYSISEEFAIDEWLFSFLMAKHNEHRSGSPENPCECARHSTLVTRSQNFRSLNDIRTMPDALCPTGHRHDTVGRRFVRATPA